MNKKILVISILLSFAILVSAQYFQPEFNLKGIAKLEYNEINVYKFHKGFSITAYPHNKLGTYQIQTDKEIDYDRQLVKLTVKLNEIELYPPIYISLESFNRNAFHEYFKTELLKKCREFMGDEDREQSEGLIPEIIIKLPKIALPRSIRRFMGNKAGRLNLNGSQRLTFAGRSTRRSDPGDERDNSTKFTPEMRQDLSLRLRGTIGEKIHVNVNHQSTSDPDVMPTPSEMNINYEGNEDEIVRAIDGGNIGFSEDV
jgi:cell surface protein SprA